MGQGLAHCEIKDQVAIVTIDHPPMNALDTATKEDIGQVFLELDDRREEIRAVILHGAGEKAFAAGADISEMKENYPPRENGEVKHPVATTTATLEKSEKAVIAMVNGYAIGGGCDK